MTCCFYVFSIYIVGHFEYTLFVLNIISQLLFILGVLIVNPNVLLLFLNHSYHNRLTQYRTAIFFINDE